MRHLRIFFLLPLFYSNLLAQDFVPHTLVRATYNIKENNQLGTSFLIDYKSNQFLVTARHLFPNAVHKTIISFKILKDTSWVTLNATVLISDTPQIDIAILQLDPSNYLPNPFSFDSPSDNVLGDGGYFLGFPFGLKNDDLGKVNYGFPFPLVKKVTFSGAIIKNGISILLLDGHNNPGFSGGPVVFMDRFSTPKNKWFIAGVVSAYVNQNKQMITPLGVLNYDENSGIIIAISSTHIISIINRK